MNPIHAIWKNGQIVPTESVDWPEGTQLAVEPIEQSAEVDLLGTDPESVTRWFAWLDSLEPLILSPEEQSEWDSALKEQSEREKSEFNERSERLKAIFE